MIRTAVLGRAASASVSHALPFSAIQRPSALPCCLSSPLPYRRPQRCKASSRKQQQQTVPFAIPYSTTSRKHTTPPPSKPQQDKGKEKLSQEKRNNTDTPQVTEPTTTKVRVTDKRTDGPSRQADLAAREASKAEKVKEAEQSQDQQKDSFGASPSEPGPSQPPSATATVSQSTTATAPQPSPTSSPQSQSTQPQPSSSPSSSSSSSSASAASTTFSSSELLKQRLQQAQDRLEKPVSSAGNKPSSDAQTATQQQQTSQNQQSQQQSQQSQSQQQQDQPQPQQSHPQQVFPASSSAPQAQSSTAANSADSSAARTDGMLPSPSVPTMENLEIPLRFPSLEILFDTRTFVKRLEDGGFLDTQRLQEQARQQLQTGDPPKDSLARQQSVLDWINAAKRGDDPSSDAEETRDAADSQDQPMELQPQANHLPHDPAQAIMELIISTLRMRAGEKIAPLLNRTEAENHRYLFDAALSDLRTELKMKARNDAATLQSITTLLQRQVDSLSNRMRDDIDQMKHDIRVSIDNRKAENKQQQRALEQEIQNLYNRFSIAVSDRKTETEMVIKGDLTRRSLLLVFGSAAIALVLLFAYKTWKKYLRAAEKEKEEAAAAAAASAAAAAQTHDEFLPQRFVNSSDGRDYGAGLWGSHPAATTQTYGPGVRGTMPHAGAGSAPGSGVHLRPAEDLGLVERYEPDAEGRYV